MSLREKYGYCLIPKGTILLRNGNDYSLKECIFFGLNCLVVNCQEKDPKPQVWQTIDDIVLLFMVSHVSRQARAISSIVEIYQMRFPEETGITDLDIKQIDFERRGKLIQMLKEEQIIGWLSSFEDNQQLEICLFPDNEAFQRLIKPIKSKEASEFVYYNALNTINLFPGEQFYARSKSACGDFSYEKYVQWFDGMINELINLYRLDKETAWRQELDLRMKLKV